MFVPQNRGRGWWVVTLIAGLWLAGGCRILGGAAGENPRSKTACEADEDCSEVGRNAACKNGRCICEPSCLTRNCGADGCGGTCGSCACGNACRSGVCTAEVADVWTGEYECRQGRTGLTLEIRGSRTELKARFTFYAHPHNSGIPTGQYLLEGSYTCEGSLELKPIRWLEKPEHYVMVGLEGTLGKDGETLVGRIADPSCGRFRIRR